MPPEDGSQVGSTVPATNADINAPAIDSTAASTVGETVGNKGDTAQTTLSNQRSLVSYAKGITDTVSFIKSTSIGDVPVVGSLAHRLLEMRYRQDGIGSTTYPVSVSPNTAADTDGALVTIIESAPATTEIVGVFIKMPNSSDAAYKIAIYNATDANTPLSFGLVADGSSHFIMLPARFRRPGITGYQTRVRCEAAGHSADVVKVALMTVSGT